jgi:hypothetical protein
MSKKVLVIFLVVLITIGTVSTAEAFSFRGILERLRLIRPIATSTRPFLGTIIANNGSSLTVKLTQGMMLGRQNNNRATSTLIEQSVIINLTNETVYTNGTIDSLVVGTKIGGQAKINDDKSLSAVKIQINPAEPNRATSTPSQNNRLHRDQGKGPGQGNGPKR